MIDTHCHLLRGLDDGPKTLEESVALARELVEAGVRTVVCTPHLSRQYPTDFDLADERLAELETALATEELELELLLAAEIGPEQLLRCDPEELRRRAIGSRFVLVELEPATPSAFPPLATAHLAENDLVPVFAHPERCRAVQRDLSLVDSVRAHGARAQIVASSVAGSWGETIRHAAWALLSSGRADLVASDSHRPHRSNNLAAVLFELAERLGEPEVRRLTVEVPGLLLA
jgi:protein-tyrosine phosphatase